MSNQNDSIVVALNGFEYMNLTVDMGRAHVQGFVNVLKYRRGDPAAKEDALLYLRKIALQRKDFLGERDTIDALVRVVASQNVELQEKAILVLETLVGRDSNYYRDMVLQTNVMEDLSNVIIIHVHQVTELQPVPRILRTSASALATFCLGQSDFEKFRSAMPALWKLISYVKDDRDNVLFNACWALYDLSCHPNEVNVQDFIRWEVCRPLVELLYMPLLNFQTKKVALRIFGNLFKVNAKLTESVIDSCEILTFLSASFSKEHSYNDRLIEEMGKEACQILANITSADYNQAQHVPAVMKHRLSKIVVEMLNQGTSVYQTRKVALIAIRNIVHSGGETFDHVETLVAQGCIRPLSDSLTIEDQDVIILALEVLDTILEMGQKQKAFAREPNPMAIQVEEEQGLDKIRSLLDHGNETISEMSHKLVRFF